MRFNALPIAPKSELVTKYQVGLWAFALVTMVLALLGFSGAANAGTHPAAEVAVTDSTNGAPASVVRYSKRNVAKAIGDVIIASSGAGRPWSVTLGKAAISQNGVTLKSSSCVAPTIWRTYHERVGKRGGETCDGSRGNFDDPYYDREHFLDTLAQVKSRIAHGIIKFETTKAGSIDRAWATRRKAFIHFTRPDSTSAIKHPIKSMSTTRGRTVIRKYRARPGTELQQYRSI